MRCWSLRWLSRPACLALLLACFAAPPAGAQGGPPLDPALAAHAEKDIRQLVTGFYEAYAKEDLAALVALWHPAGPGRYARNVVEMEFELRDATLRSVSVGGLSVDAGGGRARVTVEMGITERKTGRSRTERRVREMTFLQDDTGAWKIWNEATSGMMLASRLLAVPAADRAALLAAEPDLASDDTLTGLGMETSRRRSQGGMAATLDAVSARELVARTLNHEHALASSLLDAGLILQVMGSIDEAGRKFAEARDLFERAGIRREVANLDANLANTDYLAGNYTSALARFEQALAVFEAEGDRARVASLLHGVGNSLYMQGQFERALEAYGRTLAMHETAANKYGAASALQAIALVHKELGNYPQAGDAYARSAALSLAAGDHNATAKALHGRGEVYRLQGDHGLALQAYHQALEAWGRVSDPPSRATTMFAIGQVQGVEQMFGAAVEWYQKALEVDTAAKTQPGIARDIGGLAGAHFAMGQADLALGEYQQSLELREALDDMPGVAWTLLHMGVLHVSQNRLDEALKAYQRAIGIAEQIGEQPALAVAHALAGSAQQTGGAAEQALESVAKALEFAGRTDQFDAIAFARTVEGKVHRDAGRSPEAREAFEAAIAAGLKVPTGPGADSFFTDRRGPYRALADMLARENQAAAALDCLERGRQHSLAVMLGGDGGIVTKGLTAAERDEEQGLTKSLRNAAVKLRRERARTKPDPERQAALREEVAKLVTQRDELRARLFAAHPDLRVLRAQAETEPVLTLLPKLLQPADAVLVFAVLDERTHVFLARLAPAPAPSEAGAERTGAPAVSVHAATIEVKAVDLAGRVGRFRESLGRMDPEAAAMSADLYSLLLLPIEAHLAGVNRVVVVPDAMLWGLPFEALRSPARRYLVDRAAVTYSPSLMAWSAATALSTGVKRTGHVLALGAPSASKSAEERIGLLRPGRKLGAAGTTERETRAVVTLAGPARGQAIVGAKATIAPLATGLTAGTVAHVAAPLFLSDASPLHSLLVLSPAAADDTGLTEIGSAIGWQTPAAAAVFPAAEGAAGGTSGEAFAALSWSLLVAGTPSVVVSRWPLAAQPPARVDPLVAGFYRALLAPAASEDKEAPGLGAALQRAAKRMMAAPATSHPGQWCGLMVIGR